MVDVEPLRESDLAFALGNAASVMAAVVFDGRSLDSALDGVLRNVQMPGVRGAIRDLSYFGLRNWGRGELAVELMSGRPTLKPTELGCLLGLGLSLIWPGQTAKYPAHTVVNEVVRACSSRPGWVAAKGLVNACLRSFQREEAAVVAEVKRTVQGRWNLPEWWVNTVLHQHPDEGRQLLEQTGMHAPFVLRVNQRWGTPDDYVAELEKRGVVGYVEGPSAVWLPKGMSVHDLPGFAQGWVSVQDMAAQLAAPLMELKAGQRVLDACAAPGGKTGHLLECADIDLTALDISAARMARVQDNVDRIAPTLGTQWRYTAKVAPAQDLTAWWDGQPFDAVLADVPCTGSGVARRHPDIPWLRRPQDLTQLSRLQHTLLDALWSVVKPGGTLTLVTCSIFQEEGPLLATAFLEQHSDAQALPAPGLVYPMLDDQGHVHPASPDGFFYARFSKRP